MMSTRFKQSIAIISFDYPPQDGGQARLSGEIVKELTHDHDVHVISELRAIVGSTTPVGPRIRDTRVTGRRPWRELAAWRQLVRVPRSSLVIAGIWYPDGLIAILAGQTNLTILAHGAELTPPVQWWRRGLWALLQRMVLTRAKVVVANSVFTAGLIQASAPAASVVAIPLAVDHHRFQPGDRQLARKRFSLPEHAIVVSTVCRIHDFKGIDVVLDAIAMLPADERQDLIYLVGGKGPHLESLKARANRLGISEHVRFLGFVSEDALPDLYRASDLFALCTREVLDRRSVEGFGLVFLEAQACGTPVVGTKSGGIPDAVKEMEGGWLIAQDNVKGMTCILNSLIRDPSKFRQAGIAARTRVERECTWEHYTDRFVQVLEGKYQVEQLV